MKQVAFLSPYEKIIGMLLDYVFFKAFGCCVFHILILTILTSGIQGRLDVCSSDILLHIRVTNVWTLILENFFSRQVGFVPGSNGSSVTNPSLQFHVTSLQFRYIFCHKFC